MLTADVIGDSQMSVDNGRAPSPPCLVQPPSPKALSSLSSRREPSRVPEIADEYDYAII